MTSMIVRRDKRLQKFDIEATLAAGLGIQGSARTQLFATAVLAAGLHAEELGIAPFQIKSLAKRVRSQGLTMISALPDELLGQALHRSVRAWVTIANAAAVTEPDSERSEVFAQWLDAVAIVLSTRAKQNSAA